MIADFLESGAIASLSQDKLLIGWGEAKNIAGKEIDMESPAFYFPDFFLRAPMPWIQFANWMEIGVEEFQFQLPPTLQKTIDDWTILQEEQFKRAFDELAQLLQSNRLKKGVPYLFAYSKNPMDGERLLRSLKRALSSLSKSTGYLYGTWHQSSGVLGVTPELLFSYHQHEPRNVYTMALAGTCSPSQSAELFMKNEKERYEHQLVVQGICQSVKPLGEVKLGEIQLLQLPKLTHLMTPMTIELNQIFDFDAMVNCLHPTPALGAFPKEEGKKWLLNFQSHTPRSFYGAPIGFRYPQGGLATCFVGIRNVQWDTQGMRIGAGCGVVKESVYEKEWQEIQLKIHAIRDQLDL